MIVLFYSLNNILFFVGYTYYNITSMCKSLYNYKEVFLFLQIIIGWFGEGYTSFSILIMAKVKLKTKENKVVVVPFIWF